jgi:hypothetical protein
MPALFPTGALAADQGFREGLLRRLPFVGRAWGFLRRTAFAGPAAALL